VDIDALLRHIGLAARPAADAAGLRAVHRAYLARVPYEDLAIQLDEASPLDADRCAARVLAGCGGYCFEVNGVLAGLLEGLGFPVERRPSVVGARGSQDPVNHLALVVEASGERWIADAGLGEGWLEPLPLRAGRHRQGPMHWTVEREPGGGWWIAQHEWGSFAGVNVGADVVGLAAFAPHHERLSSSPESSFVQTLVVQRPLADRVVTLRARTLTARGPAVDERRTIADADDLAAVLTRTFGIDRAVLGERRLAELWRRACAQHDAWVARQAA
jgi:N-hydroxyarylamine O-acetyltransferase